MSHDRAEATARIEKALEHIRQGRMVVLVDDEDRENEGDLCMAAEKCTPEAVNFMARFGRGLICLTLTEAHVRRLGLHMMVSENTAPLGTAFTVSIDAASGISTGISAADRSKTIIDAVEDDADHRAIVTPGHIFPLRAKDGGVLVRSGQTEGSVDLSRLAGLKAAGVICEIMNDDGTMARMPDLRKFAERHEMPIVSIADLIHYRLQHESTVHGSDPVALDTLDCGTWQAQQWRAEIDPEVHLTLVKGEINPDEPVLVRVHAERVLGDVFQSTAHSGGTLQGAMKLIADEGRGVVLYLHRKRDTDILRAAGEGPAASQSTVMRNIGVGCQILRKLGVRKLRLLSNRPHKLPALDGFGLQVVEQVAIPTPNASEDS